MSVLLALVILTLFSVVLMFLKLIGIISIGWWIVMSPPLMFIGIMVIMLIIYFVSTAMISKKQSKLEEYLASLKKQDQENQPNN